MATQHFIAEITRSGSKTIIPIPFNPNEVWGEKQRHHVTGIVNGCAVRGPIDIDENQFFLRLGASWCRQTGLEVGIKADVTLTPEGPQLAQLPPDLISALDDEPQARIFFESLATFYRKAYIKWIEGAKRKPEIRDARIRELIVLLKDGRKQR